MAIADAAKHLNFQFKYSSLMLIVQCYILSTTGLKRKKRKNIQRRQHSVPICLRWDVPPNDGLMDDESIKECREFLTKKGLELIDFLLLCKQRIMKLFEAQIKDIKDRIEPC